MYGKRIVITGIGLTAPNGNSLFEYRESLLSGRSGVVTIASRYIGEVHAGVCDFDVLRHQKKKEARRGTRAGSISIYCAREALADSGLVLADIDPSRTGVYIGITEHGNVETENEIYNISQYGYDVKYWSHHHNPRTVANNPAGEVTINMGITGPHYCIGAACAAGNMGIIQGVQQLILDEVEIAIAGGVSESIHTFGIFAAFASQNALARHEDPTRASRPFDKARNGIVVAEGGALYILETLERAKVRGARIYGEIIGHACNSDTTDFVLPNSERQAQCMEMAIGRAGLRPSDVDVVSTHATATQAGDIEEAKAIRRVFGASEKTCVNNTKSFIGHAMGAAGALELAGNIPSFTDGLIHPTINLDDPDPECEVRNLVSREPREVGDIRIILNSSFGMLGINSSLVVRKYEN